MAQVDGPGLRGLAVTLAGQILKMSLATPIAESEADLLRLFQQVYTGVDYPATDGVPAHRIFSNGYTRIVLVGGASNNGQLRLYYAAALTRTTIARRDCNSYCYDVSQLIQSHADDFAGNPSTQFYAGYSLGGAIVQTLVANLSNPLPVNQNGVVLTFGSPRYFQRHSHFPETNGFVFWRYMHYQDSVPHFPPRAEESSIGNALANAEAQLAISQSEHVGQGIVLANDGSTVLSDLNHINGPITELSLWSWLLFANSPSRYYHLVATYYSDLQLGDYDYSFRDWATSVIIVGHDLPWIEGPGHIMARAKAVAQVAIAEAAFAQARGPEPEQAPYYAIKRGGVWTVEYLGDVIVIKSTKRTCRAFAKRMNAAWRQWYRVRIGAPDVLSASVAEAFL